jgi:hypothetical protein
MLRWHSDNRRKLVLVAFGLALLAACNRYDKRRLENVCDDGSGYGATAAYDRAAFTGSEMAMALVYRWPKTEWTLDTPKRFRSGGLVSPSPDNYKSVALVMCIEQKPGAFLRDCGGMEEMNVKMQVGGDNKTEAHSTGRQVTLKHYGSQYVLTLREAKTGHVIANKTLDVNDPQCPLLTLGDSNEDYARISEDEIVAFMAPFLPTAIAARLKSATD